MPQRHKCAQYKHIALCILRVQGTIYSYAPARERKLHAVPSPGKPSAMTTIVASRTHSCVAPPT
eukprot:6198869-Pleurochrysis_carterae.AAC.5